MEHELRLLRVINDNYPKMIPGIDELPESNGCLNGHKIQH
jgi:hypothetical protein